MALCELTGRLDNSPAYYKELCKHYAEQAEQSAENAENSATSAEQHAETATDKATEASNSADLAREWAIKTDGLVDDTDYSAKQYALNAEDSATIASGKADDASASATLAEKWATYTNGTVDGNEYSAKKYAQDASNSATTATNKATEASNYAQTATNKASEAGGYAQTASDKAGIATTQAGLAGGSALSASNSATLAEKWATKTDGTVDGTNYSAKKYAENAQTFATNAGTSEINAGNSATLAEKWATLMGDTVDGNDYSAKYYANEADGYATSASNSASSAQSNADYIQTEATKIDTTEKRVSNIEKLLQGNLYDYQTDSTSAYTKTVPAGAMPYASLDSIGGKTLAWNQLMYDGNFTDATVWRAESVPYSATSVANNELSITVIQTPTAFYNLGARRGNHFTSYVAGHKYLMQMEVYLPYASSAIVGRGPNIIDNASGQLTIASNVVANTWTQCSGIFTAKQANNTDIYIAPNTFADYQVGDTWKMRNYILVDLTLLYGSGNEPSTVAEFQQQFPAPYYAFTQVTLLSAGVTEVKSVGRNIWDEEWEVGGINTSTGADNSLTDRIRSKNYISVQSGKTYYFSNGTNNMVMLTYRYDKTYTGSYYYNNPNQARRTIPSDVGYIRFYMVSAYGTTYHNDICINVSDSKNGTYTPYMSETYPIPASIQALEGYGWSAGTVFNYVDYEAKKFVKRVGAVDLGTLTYSRGVSSVSGLTYFDNHTITNKKVFPQNQPANLVCAKFIPTADNKSAPAGSPYGVMYSLDAYLTLYADYPDVPTFQSAMSGVMLYYELATPIEVDISEYITDDNLIEVEAGGSLTFENQNGDDYRIPVPSAETYMIDLQSALGE